MNLFDIMRGAGGGDAFSTLARQYGLSDQQVRQAVEAFMPAFSAGLKRATDDPMGVMELMRRMAAGNLSRAYENPAWAFGDGRRAGDDALSFLFGSNEAAQAIARQASAFTGIAQAKLAELLPALAAMVFGGLAAQATAANPVLEAMLKQFRAGGQAKPAGGDTTPAGKGPLDRYEDEQEQREREAAENVARSQQEMMQAGLAAFEAGTAAWRQAMDQMMQSVGGGAVTGDAKRPETEASGRDVFGEMFQPGVKLGEAYQRELEELVRRFTPETRRS
jgi:hypothetical protein